jgi:dihydrofolate synthase / folylpolyglutamate synthase
MQRLAQGPIASLVGSGGELWVDGGHNADGGRVIANALADLEDRVSRPLALIVGMLGSKDCKGFLQNFVGLAQRLIAVPIAQQEKSLSADAIVDIARALGIPAQGAIDIEAALAAVERMQLHPAPRILITGSLYLAGEALAANGSAPV